jgi:alpha-glucosidase (family GH31 glycosyl hydrolase)
VIRNYQILKEHDVPIAAVWMQDWVGTKEFPEGVRLLWNWKLNRVFYPQWDEMIANWTKDGVKAMVYINQSQGIYFLKGTLWATLLRITKTRPT